MTIAIERTHPVGRDLDWLPFGSRALGRLVTAAMFAVAGVAIVAGLVVVPIPEQLYVTGPVALLPAGFLSERARRALMRRAVARLARGEIHLAAVDAREEGELVVVRGKIVADELLPGVIHRDRGVYRRLTMTAVNQIWIHEAAVDFSLIDAEGGRIRVQGAGARWLIESQPMRTYHPQELDREGVPPVVRDLVRRSDALIPASERVLTAGTEIEVVGYKTVTTDPTGTATDYRSAPQRATLRSGPRLPLVIISDRPAS